VKGRRKVKWEDSGREGGGNGMEVCEEEDSDYQLKRGKGEGV
jgi:hypothetical protein